MNDDTLILGGYSLEHVHDPASYSPFYYFYSLPFTQISNDLLYIFSKLIIYDFSPILRSENYVVLAYPFCMR